MKKILTAQVLTETGITTFAGLYDRDGSPVTIELEKDSGGVTMIIHYETSEENDCYPDEEEFREICGEHDNCDDCPVNEYCEKIYGEDQ